MEYKLLPAQKEFMLIPHNYQRDIALYQGGYALDIMQKVLNTTLLRYIY